MIKYNNVGKIAFLGDTHFGVKNDNTVFLEHFLSFFEKEFFPFLLKNKIKHVIQFGDLMDKRKSVNFVTLDLIKTRFFNFFKENDIELHVLLGNHDVYYKSTNKVNSVEGLFSDLITIYNAPTEVTFDNTKFLIIPWITDDNSVEVYDYIKKTDAKYCLSHLELSGFEFAKGILSYNGTNKDPFEKFEHVWTGHYHTSSTQGNITYLGTPYEITWSDFNDPKKVYLFDCGTKEIESFSLNQRMFVYVDWDETASKEWLTTGKIDIKGKYNAAKGCSFKISVHDANYDMQVDSFVKWLDKAWLPTKISVIDIYNIIQADVDIDNIRVKSPVALLHESVLNFPRNNELNHIIKDIYEQALLEQIDNE
ncbi:MAG: metallophosphoesterase [Candidatus Izemoplasma sp.]